MARFMRTFSRESFVVVLRPFIRHGLSGLLTLLICGSLPAAQPNIGNLLPRGGQRGAELEVEFTGARLGDAMEVVFDRPGIEVKSLTVEGDDKVKAVFNILPDAPLGLRAARLRTASDISNLKLFSVGTLKEVQENEPNGSGLDKAQKIELNSTVNGRVQNEDVDNFAIELAAGQRVNFEVEALRLADTAFDCMLVLFNPKGIEIAAADDTVLVAQDSALGFTAEEAGVYTIQVRESSFGGNNSSWYRLHVGTYPRPMAAFPPGGKPGETIEIDWLGEPLLTKGPFPIPAEPNANGLYTEVNGLSSPTATPFRFTDLTNFIEVEPNNNKDQATTITLPGAANGFLGEDGDHDWFVFDAKAGQTFDFQLYGRRLRSPIDSVIHIFKADGNSIEGNDDAAGPDSRITWSVPEDGRYYARVIDHLDRGGPMNFYRLEVSPPKPELAIGMPGMTGASDNTPFLGGFAGVPIGNRVAQTVILRRSGVGGTLKLAAENLPPGVTAHLIDAPEGQDEIPILFEAAADTTVTQTLVDLVARPENAELAVEGHLDFAVTIVKIENNITFQEYPVNRLATAVTLPVPFKIEVVEPKVPLVRRGRMYLMVKATRDEGFNDPIELKMMWNPPGIGSGTAKLEAGQTTATLELNANPDAPINTWKLAVIAKSTNPHGGAAAKEVSSQLFPLTISEPWVNVALEKARTEQGTQIELKGEFTANHPFEGEALVELVNLPNGAGVAEQIKATKDTKELKYVINVAADAQVGKFNPFARVTVMDQGEPLMHFLGGTELRVDKPLPPPAGEPTPTPAPAQAEAPPKKEGPQRGDRKPAVGTAPFNTQ